MEFDIGEILLCHHQHIAGIGQIDIAALFVERHILSFTAFEVFKSGSIVAFYPASLIEADRFPLTLRTVFVEQAVLDHFELQLSDRTDNLTSVELVGKELGDAFIHQLLDALVQLLAFIGSAFSIYLNISGEKLGNPLK